MKIRDNISFIFFLLFLMAVVGVMSWRDMHPPPPDFKSQRAAFLSYYAGEGITYSMVPDDDMPVTVGVGMFRYDADGKMEWIPAGMPPSTFAQRQLTLVFRFESIPEATAETFKQVQAVVDTWKFQGNRINSLLVDHRPAQVDFPSYGTFLKVFHKRFQDEYSLLVAADPLWAEADVAQLVEPVNHFWIDAGAAKPTAEFLGALKKFNYRFALRFPHGVIPDDMMDADFAEVKSLRGYVWSLDPHKPWPVKERKIGLWPKL